MAALKGLPNARQSNAPHAGFDMLKQTEMLMLTLCGEFGDGLSPIGVREFRRMKELMTGGLFMPDDSEVGIESLLDIGFDSQEAERIMALISREKQVAFELDRLAQLGIRPVCRISENYPHSFISKLGDSAPSVLFCAGNIELLKNKAAALVGSRQLGIGGAEFAKTFGKTCAEKGLTLVSGGAEGADMIAQQSALSSGGAVISFRPDSLIRNKEKLSSEINEGKLLVISERGADCAFSAASAAARNRLIHSYCDKVFVAGSGFKKGGTWSGTETNLKKGYSKVYVFNDGSQGCRGLIALGALPVELDEIVSCL